MTRLELMTLNEVPGDESRQSAVPFASASVVSRPSMKCREMNPGNVTVAKVCRVVVSPSMKCREMNPGNTEFMTDLFPDNAPLNEVPGDESRQC